MRLKASLILLITCCCYCLAGFLLLPVWGELVGLISFVVLGLSLLRFYETIILCILDVHFIRDKGLINTAHNESVLCGMKDAQLAYSKRISNIRVVSTPFSRKVTIVVGSKLADGLNERVVRDIVKLYALEYRLGLTKVRKLLCISHLLVYAPALLLRVLPKKVKSFIQTILSFLIFPVDYIIQKEAKLIQNKLKSEDMIELSSLINKNDQSVKAIRSLNLM